MAVSDPVICHMVILLVSLNGLNGQEAQSRAYEVKEQSAEDAGPSYYGVAHDSGFPVGFGGFASFFDKSDSVVGFNDGGFGAVGGGGGLGLVGHGNGGFGVAGSPGFASLGFFPFESRNSRDGFKPVLPSSTFWMGPPPPLLTGPSESADDREQEHSGEEYSGEEDGPPPPRPYGDYSGERDSSGSAEETSRQYTSGEVSDHGPSPQSSPYSESPLARSSPRGAPPSRTRVYQQPRPYPVKKPHANPLRPFYKTISPTKTPQINKSYLKPNSKGEPERGNRFLRVHQHSFGISHDPPKPKSHSPNYSADSQRRAQPVDSRPHKNRLFFNFPSTGWDEFRPSPPDPLQDDIDRISGVSDFFPEHSHVNLKTVKKRNEKEAHKTRNEPSCQKSNKTVTTKSPDATLDCFICTDGKTGKVYEECRQDEAKNKPLQRPKREVTKTEDHSERREKRQYEYASEEYSLPSARRDYSYGPDHFSGEDMSLSYEEDVSFDRDSHDDRDRDSETCRKLKKGGMICIACENTKTGGTYEQCSYASDPKKNSYETSYSKSYGSSRDKAGGKKQQNPRPSKRRSHSRAPSPHDVSDARDSPPLPPHPPKRRQLDKDVSSHEDLSERGPPRPAKRPGVSRKQYSARVKNGPVVEKWSRRSRLSAPVDMPPPSSRAYSTPSPIGPNPFSMKIPDPYNPPDTVSVDLGYDDDDEVPPLSSHERYSSTSRNRKYDDFEADYDTSFNFFPGLPSGDSDPISIAPHVEYEDVTGGEADVDYPVVPSRRTSQGQADYSMKQPRVSNPAREEPVEETKKSYEFDRSNSSSNQRHSNVTCKQLKKDKMRCLECTGTHGSRSEECVYLPDTERKSKKQPGGESRSLNKHELLKQNESSHNWGNSNQNEPRAFQQSTPRGVGSHHSSNYQFNNGHHDTRFQPNGHPLTGNYLQKSRDETRSTPSPYSSHAIYPPLLNQHGHYNINALASDSQTDISDRGKRKYKKYSPEEPNKKSFGDKDPPSSSDSLVRPRDLDKQLSSRQRAQYNSSRSDLQDHRASQSNNVGEVLSRHSYNPIPTNSPTLKAQSTVKPDFSERGKYSPDTQLVFDRALGIPRPKYMPAKSEDEAVIDEASG